jgi:NitT/TauT family transport system substrate-binding protein
MKKRSFLACTALAVAALTSSAAYAQTTPIKFQLDWRFEGPSALFLTTAAKGYFKDAKLDVTIDAGNGSGARSPAWHRVPTTWAWPTWPR